MKKALLVVGIVFGLAVVALLLYFFVFRKDLTDKIVIPYITHQKPRIDPHLPSSVPIADKMDEALFDGIFNISANASGITYEDGLGEYIGIDEKTKVVTVRLKPSSKWHSSFAVAMKKDKITITEKQAVYFLAKDLKFTMRRIQKLGSLSPDYILISQAIAGFDFTGPDENGEIKFQFRKDRIWNEADIKEVLSFKVIPASSDMNASQYLDGTGPYMYAGQYEDIIFFPKSPAGNAAISNLLLKPFIDNSTYTTELKNRNINVLLSTPFGSLSPILGDSTEFFFKSNISTCFFALFYNTERLTLQQRLELRKFINNKTIIDRFFKVNTEQQRHITDYKGNWDNYADYLNYSVFPASTYYVEEKIIVPLKEYGEPDLSVLPDTVRIKTCLNYDFREELSELVQIMNDPSLFHGKLKVYAVQNEELRAGNYDAALVPVSGYRSNFLFDLYDIFLREPDLAVHQIHLVTETDAKGALIAGDATFTADKNFFRLDLSPDTKERDMKKKLLEYVYGFMATSEIGDKQAYANMIDQLDQQMALGTWLFSLPSLAYFRTQFDDKTIDLYGVASQLSTVEKWREKPKE